MNTRRQLESPSTTQVLSVSFNADGSCFSVGLNTGICVFQTKTCLMKSSRDFNAGIGLVQMMGTSNYLGLVGGGTIPKFASNKVIVWDDQAAKPAIEISTLSPVRGLQISRQRIVVALQNSIRLYQFVRPPQFVGQYETANNVLGLCCLSEKFIAFPGRTPGQVQLVEVDTNNVSIIPAHSSALRALSLSQDNQLLATASDTGTIIRVFSTSNCAKIAELRRGIDPATVFSLAFSPSGDLLACTSDKSTLHIFDVPNPKSAGKKVIAPTQSTSSLLPGPGDGEGRGKWGILGKIPLMPSFFSDVYSFASVPFEGGDESLLGGIPVTGTTNLGTARPQKGLIGWVGEDGLVVVGAGRDAKWEKFNILKGEEGRRICDREGWKKYLAR